MKSLLLLGTHIGALIIGFALGIYALPILIAPAAPSATALAEHVAAAQFSGQFRRELADSDALHWGEGRVIIGPSAIVFEGKLAPGPDYRLYLSPQFVETEAEFQRLKSTMVQVGEVKTFNNFVVPLSASIDAAQYRAVIVWCEAFNEFITAASYQ